MAVRFRKSIKIAPGIRINVSKSGVSTSIGGKGATVNLSKRGTRVTAGLPGTGLSASHLYKAPKQPSRISSSRTATKERSPAELAISAIALEIAAIAIWAKAHGLFSFLGAIVAIGIPAFYFLSRRGKRQDRPAITEAAEDNPRDAAAPAHVQTVTPPASRADAEAVASALEASLTETRSTTDYLLLAAETGKKAKEAARNGDLDAAWSHYHEQKDLHLQHAKNQGWNSQDTLALYASVHEGLADVLRLQKKHTEALPHILYWVAANHRRPIQRHADKIRAYFNRCRLKNTSLDEVEGYVSSLASNASYSRIRAQVAEWVSKG